MPSANLIIRSLNHGDSDEIASVLLVTIWELGEATGPLFIAPLSELFGRKVVLYTANALFLFATTLTALCNSVPLLIAARALTGLAVASSVLNPSIIGDMFVPAQRGSAMTMMVTAPLVGSAVGPAIGGVMAEKIGWRQLVWISVALAGVCLMGHLTYFKETYRATVAQQGGKTSHDKEPKSGLYRFCSSLLRPASILCSSWILAGLCLCHGLDFIFYYVIAVTLPDILSKIYGQPASIIGLSFVCISEWSLSRVSKAELTIFFSYGFNYL